ncbi:hypothetical protein HN51_062167 [Arachis hypogaea]
MYLDIWIWFAGFDVYTKANGYTGADPYKISFQVGREKFLIPWLPVVNQKSTEVSMIEVELTMCLR